MLLGRGSKRTLSIVVPVGPGDREWRELLADLQTGRQALPKVMGRARSRENSAAVAIFVKTPGLSPIKTRLAATLGNVLAQEFYLHAVRATQAVVSRVATELPWVTPFWAVAEEAGLGHLLWNSYGRIWQGEGGLGERLGRTYEELRRTHRRVILIGADCPLLSPTHLRTALSLLADSPQPSRSPARSDFVIGPATDGGFYLFGGNGPLPPSAWTSVPYSAPDTAERLEELASRSGSVNKLAVLSDVDTEEDLRALPESDAQALEAQNDLLIWARLLSKTGLVNEKTVHRARSS